jgi:PAS domain S-box-containing protein
MSVNPERDGRTTAAPAAQPGPDAPHSPRRGSGAYDVLTWLVVGNVVVIALVITLAVAALNGSRNAYGQRAIDAAENIASGLEQVIAGTIGRIDMGLQTVALVHDREAVTGSLSAATLARVIEAQHSLLPEIDSLRATDAQGRVIMGRGVLPEDPVSLEDREFFRRARDTARPTLLISGPLEARISRKWVIVLARRLNRADGSFAGVVYANVSVDFFQRLFGAFDTGPGGAISLRNSRLELVARQAESRPADAGVGTVVVSPQLRQAVTSAPRAGSFVARAASDQIERAAAYRQVGPYPLIVIVGLANRDYLAPWWTEVAVVGSAAVLLVVLLAGASTLIHRAWQRERATSLSLLREGRRQHAFMLTASDSIHVLDRSGRLREMSDSFAAMLGQTRDELSGQHVSSWDSHLAPEAMAEALRTFRPGQRLAFSTRHRRRDGSLLEVEVSCTGVSLDGEDLLYCSARDVTRRRQAERALRASEAFLDRTGRVASVGGWELDLRDGMLTWSEQTCRIHDVEPGYRPTLDEALRFYPPSRARSSRRGCA